MYTREETIVDGDHLIQAKPKACCNNCKNKPGNQNAHCGTAYVLKRGTLEKTDPSNIYESANWQLKPVIDLITTRLHTEFYKRAPLITAQLQTLLNTNGPHYRLVQQLDNVFANIRIRLTSHFLVEQNVVFPHISRMVHAKKYMEPLASDGVDDFRTSVRVLEAEHSTISALMEQMQQLTNNYTPPAGSIEPFAGLFPAIEQFNETIRQHIHLENNSLYPNSLLLQKELDKLGLLR